MFKKITQLIRIGTPANPSPQQSPSTDTARKVGHIARLGHQEIISHNPVGEEPKKIGSSFFRGEHSNFNPYQRDFKRSNFLEKFLLKGLTPDEPLLKQNTKITAFGSCFASNITKHLSSIGYDLSKDRNPDIYISTMGEGLVNVHALAQQFEWALENTPPQENLWHGYKAEEFGYDERVRVQTANVFKDTDFFIITLGLSEVWYDEVTRGVFWRAIPQAHYDPSRHKFRVCSFAETKERIERMYSLIRKHVPKAKVLFTLSPIPLAATFRPIGCIAANSASKSILRAALDEFYREKADELNKNLFYFPSYEIVTDLFFSRYGDDNRHVHSNIINLIMKLFEAVYCDTPVTVKELNALFQEVRVQNAQLVAGTVANQAEDEFS